MSKVSLSDAELTALYGPVPITRNGVFTFIHLDNPTLEVAEQRSSAFDPTTYFVDDCPLCTMQREGGIIAFTGDEA